MTAATVVLAALCVLGGGLVALLAWRDVHPAPPAKEDHEPLARLLAARYRPAKPEPARPGAFEWSGPGESLAAVPAGPDPVAAFVQLLGDTSLDAYAREPETRDRVRAEIAGLLADRA